MSGNNQLQGQSLEYRGFRLIPLVIEWDSGTPAIKSNPLNEEIELTDNGIGDVTLTFAEAALTPLQLAGAVPLGASNSAKLGSVALQGVPTATVVRLLFKEVTVTAPDNVAVAAADPVEIHLTILKAIVN